MGRAPCCDKASVKKGPWSAEEDAKLKAYIEEHGTGGNWIALPHKIGLKRCGKSCRLRWLNYLRPNIKHGGFTEEEDQIICSLYISIGSRWSIIAAQLPGRTDNDIKNYWNTRLKKKLLGKRRDSSSSSSSFQSRRLHLDQTPNLEVDAAAADGAMKDEAHSQTLSASALERMQLHMQLQGLYSTAIATNPFSLYHHPALWPKCHPLGDRADQTLAAAPPQDYGADETLLGSLYHRSAPSFAAAKPERMTMMISPNNNNTMREEKDQSSQLGLISSPSGSNFDSTNLGHLQADLQSLLYCKNMNSSSPSAFGHEEHQVGGDYLYGEKEMNGSNWWSGNGLIEDALGLHAESLMVQDYALRYDDL